MRTLALLSVLVLVCAVHLACSGGDDLVAPHIEGDYYFVVQSHPSCSAIPSALRSFVCSVHVELVSDTDFVVVGTGSCFGKLSTLVGSINGDVFTFGVGVFEWIETTCPKSIAVSFGTMQGVRRNGVITGSILGNWDAQDGCTLEVGECTAAHAFALAVEFSAGCGNGVVESGEQCDDGNVVNGDGCSSVCEDQMPAECGDGIVEGSEECDDGNSDPCDRCSPNCTESKCTCCPSSVVPVCSEFADAGTFLACLDACIGGRYGPCQNADGCFLLQPPCGS